MFTYRRAKSALSIPVLTAALVVATPATPAVATPQPVVASIASTPSAVFAAAKPKAKQQPLWKRRRKAVRFAHRQLGKPYKWGGEGPHGYDCSGLTLAAWLRGKERLPHSSRMQASQTRRITWRNKQPGDLLFYGKPVHHVAMYVGNGKMIEAPRRGLKVRKVSAHRRGRVKIGRP